MANKSARPFQNGVKPGHAIILLVFLLIRYCYGGPSSGNIIYLFKKWFVQLHVFF